MSRFHIVKEDTSMRSRRSDQPKIVYEKNSIKLHLLFTVTHKDSNKSIMPCEFKGYSIPSIVIYPHHTKTTPL